MHTQKKSKTFDLGTDGLTDIDPAVRDWMQVYASVPPQE